MAVKVIPVLPRGHSCPGRRNCMRIMVLNTRDIANPSSGGAEVYMHEICMRLVNEGNEVTVIAAGFPGCEKRECIDGVGIIRLGRFPSVYPLARAYYEKHLKGAVDIIVDAYTLRPFLSNRYAVEPVVFLVFELAREKYFRLLPPGISHLGYHWLEPAWIKGYRNGRTVTISESTKEELLRFGFTDINIVPVGLVTIPAGISAEKEECPTFLYVGMLKKLNLVDDVMEAFQLITNEIPGARLWIAGRGPAGARVERIAKKRKNISFFGFVDERKKYELMSRAHLLLMPAVREGWGMVVTEANACGTPAVGYNVPGLRDSIKDGLSGILTDCNPSALAAAAVKVIMDKGLGSQLSRNARDWSRGFSWDRSAAIFLDILERERTRPVVSRPT